MDVNGVLVVVFAISVITGGIFLAPILVYFGFDSVTQIFSIIFPHILDTPSIKFFVQIVSYLLLQWISIEGSRIYISVCIPTMTICTLYLNILKIIKDEPLNLKTILLYQQLSCINQMGLKVIAGIAGTLMSAGFFLSIFGNWVIVSGGSLIPKQIYVYILGTTIISYIIIDQTIPLAIGFNELSCDILMKWRFNVLSQKAGIKYWKKKIRAQQTLSFYYGYTKFERDTQVNYYSNIVNYSINALIVFKRYN